VERMLLPVTGDHGCRAMIERVEACTFYLKLGTNAKNWPVIVARSVVDLAQAMRPSNLSS
jgi:hypothetical protein